MGEGSGLITGKAHCYGDNVDTDVIIPGKYMSSNRLEDLIPHALEGIDPDFPKKVNPGDLIIAGKNFGCGSSRETAVTVLRGNGIRAVIAESFARIFYRNAINLGLLVVECPGISKDVSPGEQIRYNPGDGTIENLTRGWVKQGTVMPGFLMNILDQGGAVMAYRKRSGVEK